MTRTTKISRKIAAAAKKTLKESKKAALHEICVGMEEASKKNNDKLPYRYVTLLLKEMKPSMSWLTRNIVNKAYIKHREDIRTGRMPSSIDTKNVGTVVSELSGGAVVEDAISSTGTDGSKKSKGGRPAGTTHASRKLAELKIVDAKNEIAKEYAAVMKKHKRIGTRVRKGTLELIIKKVSKKMEIKDTILPATIRQRYYRKHIVSHHVGGHISPLNSIEPTIIEIILQMARIRQSITPSKGLMLVNSLIKGMPIQKELIKWKKKFSNDTLGTVGKGYWDRFIIRNKHKLVSKRGQKYELNRQKWTTYCNFVDMYHHAIQEMVDAGVAKKLDEPVWMTRDGKICVEREAFGCKVTHELVKPHLCICGDEVGGNLCMKGDGHIGGQLLLTAPGKVPQRKASSKNKRFTLIGLTALTGEPVMAVIILQGKRPQASLEAGIDINVDPIGNATDSDYLQKNSGPNKYFPGGPVCHFNGKTIPPFVRWHESGSITSQILTEALQTLDHFEVFERSESTKPFILLDGHSSRLELPFLKYINNPKDHWVCCIGVPYGTALWQVGDSKQQNGSFNIAISRAKQDLVQKKESLGLPPSLVDTDMMPLINMAWQQSFAKISSNKRAIADRGWNPLNRAILTNDDLRATMTTKELEDEALPSSNIILPNKIASANPSSHDDKSDTTVTDDSTSPSEQPSSAPHVNQQLNFSDGTAAFCIDALLSETDLQKSRARIKGEHQKGLNIRERLRSAKRVTSGVVFGCGTTRLGKTVFDICQENEDKKRKERNDKMKEHEIRFKKDVDKANEVLQKKSDLNKMTIRELTLICKPLKRKSDGPMPTKKAGLIAKYNEWKGRPAPEFSFENDPAPEAIVNDCDSDDDIDIENVDIVNV